MFFNLIPEMFIRREDANGKCDTWLYLGFEASIDGVTTRTDPTLTGAYGPRPYFTNGAHRIPSKMHFPVEVARGFAEAVPEVQGYEIVRAELGLEWHVASDSIMARGRLFGLFRTEHGESSARLADAFIALTE